MSILPRILAALLSLSLALPSSAFALRQNQPETKEQRTGLEEALLSKDPATEPFERAATALGLSPSKTGVPISVVSPRSSSATVPSAAGLEEHKESDRRIYELLRVADQGKAGPYPLTGEEAFKQLELFEISLVDVTALWINVSGIR